MTPKYDHDDAARWIVAQETGHARTLQEKAKYLAACAYRIETPHPDLWWQVLRIAHGFTEITASELGRRGGKAKSDAKREASRRNGTKGGHHTRSPILCRKCKRPHGLTLDDFGSHRERKRLCPECYAETYP